MAKTFRQTTQVDKIYRQATAQQKVFFKNYEVYSSGYIVSYHIDTGNVVSKEIDDGDDAIAQAPTATKSGWTFVGWRIDTQANPTVLPSYTVTADVSLYAVFTVQITVSLVGGSTTLYNRGNRYYNNGTIANPAITLNTATLSGWTLVGYRTDTRPDATCSYYGGSTYTFAANTTLYTVFKQTVTGQVTCKGTLYSFPKTRYVNNGNYNNPSFSFADQSLDDAVFKGYSTSSSSITIAIASLTNGYTLTQDIHFYAVWRYNDALLFESPDPYQQTIQMWMTRTGQYTVPSRAGTDFDFNGVKYETISVTLRASANVAGWSTQNNVWIYMYDAQSTWVLHASRGSQQGQWEEGPCADGRIATINVITTQQNPTHLYVDLSGDLDDHSEINISKLYGNGRTLVY